MRVMVYPAEIREIVGQSTLSWDEVAEPYPEEITLPSGTRCTFEWALRTREGKCIFFKEGHCQVYPVRPWICRTYPFMLAGPTLRQSECPGLGEEMQEEEARALAHDLICRREVERVEEGRVQNYSGQISVVKGRFILIDGEGVKVLEP
jgi:Fe-S-cluster containining protein